MPKLTNSATSYESVTICIARERKEFWENKFVRSLSGKLLILADPYYYHGVIKTANQCCGSASVSGFNGVPGSGSGFRRAKLPTDIEESRKITFFEVLEVLFWGLKVSSAAWTLGFTRNSGSESVSTTLLLIFSVPDPRILTTGLPTRSCSFLQWLFRCLQNICSFLGFLLIPYFWYILHKS